MPPYFAGRQPIFTPQVFRNAFRPVLAAQKQSGSSSELAMAAETAAQEAIGKDLYDAFIAGGCVHDTLAIQL